MFTKTISKRDLNKSIENQTKEDLIDNILFLQSSIESLTSYLKTSNNSLHKIDSKPRQEHNSLESTIYGASIILNSLNDKLSNI